jgi:hypothetical protein
MSEVVHYLGHIIAPPGQTGRFRCDLEAEVAARIEQALKGVRVSVAYGALAAGADILLAEALLRHGAALQVVLPFERDDFVAASVRPSGSAWVDRFNACLNQAACVRFATTGRYLGCDHLFTYSSQIAMGLAILYARHLRAGVRQIAVWDGKIREEGVAGTAVDMCAWHHAGHPQTIIPIDPAAPATSKAFEPRNIPAVRQRGRHPRAVLLGEICGFRESPEMDLSGFATHVTGTLDSVLGRYRQHADRIHAWRNGVFGVFPDAGVAAVCALELHEAMASLDLAAYGLPTNLRLRLAAHIGSVYEVRDLLRVVPKDRVFMSEKFAAILALCNADAVRGDCAGGAGMFALRRRGAGV